MVTLSDEYVDGIMNAIKDEKKAERNLKSKRKKESGNEIMLISVSKRAIEIEKSN